MINKPLTTHHSLLTKKGFTFAEAIVALFILSLVMVSSLPVLMKNFKAKSVGASTASGSLWTDVGDGSGNIYYGTTASPVVVIGAAKRGTGDTSRLQLRTAGATNNDNAIAFNQGPTNYGKLMINSNRNMALGKNITFTNASGQTIQDGIWIGHDIQSICGSPHNGVAIGNGSSMVGDNGAESHWATSTMAIGYHASTSASETAAIGSNTVTAAGEAAAIGHSAIATTDWYLLAIGHNAQAYGFGNIAIGANAESSLPYDGVMPFENFYSHSTAIGSYPSTHPTWTKGYRSTTAIGGYGTSGAQPTGHNQIVLGSSSNNAVVIPGSLTVSTASTTTITNTLTGNVSLGTLGTTGTVILYRATGNVISVSSDRRLKDIHGEFTSGLNEIRQLKPYNYTLKKDKDKTPLVGVMAQDLQKVFPNAVSKNEKGYLMIRQDDMFYALLNSIKQLDKILTNLKIRLQQAEDRILALLKVDKMTTKKIKDLEAINKKYEARIAKLEKLKKG